MLKSLLVAVVAIFGAISIFVIVVIKLRLDQRKGESSAAPKMPSGAIYFQFM